MLKWALFKRYLLCSKSLALKKHQMSTYLRQLANQGVWFEDWFKLKLLLRFYWCSSKNQLSYSMNSFLLPLSTFTLVLKERSVLLLLQPKSYYLSWYCSFFSFTGIIISILMVIHSYANSLKCTVLFQKVKNSVI